MIPRRLVHVAAVLFVVSVVLAFLLDLTPGDPAFALLGDQATPEQVAQVHRDLHLDDPIVSRYWRWLTALIQGDLGQSYVTKQDVSDQIAQRLPVTAELAVLALVVALAVSTPIGIYAAHKRDRAFDKSWSVVSSVLIGTPTFVVALLLVSAFALSSRSPVDLPVTGWVGITEDFGGHVQHLLLPVTSLALPLIPQFSRLLRADMIATLDEDYITAARAKGIAPRRLLLHHALRPSMFSLVTVAGISLGQLIGGAVVIETLFALPGLGQLMISSIANKDIITVQGVVMFVAIAYVAINTLVDLAYGRIDPRVRIRPAR